jgi:hypothetical protein
MNDKELLERAARAIGIEIESCTCSSEKWPVRKVGGGHWNPLFSLSDAAELALLRSINVVFLPDRVYAGLTVFEPYTDADSKRKAYCRAVTRAAAQY